MPKRINKYRDYPDVTSRTREILDDEEWYGDGPPQWREGKAQRPAQTADEAHDVCLKLVRRIRRHAADNPEAQSLADRLDSCAPSQRCMSAACSECGRAYTRWFVTSASALLKSFKVSVSVLSLVHADLSVSTGQLTSEFIKEANRKTRAKLKRVNILTFIGGIDISANEDETEAADPHFQIQSWVLALTHEVRKAETKLRAAFPKTKTIPRPVKIKEWDGDLAALAYALKNSFDRRVSIICEDKPGLRKPYRDTRDRDLRVEQQIELMIALDRTGLHARLHLGGCRVVHTADGPMIRLIKEKRGSRQR